MSNLHLYLIIGGLVTCAAIFFTFVGHDTYLMSIDNDKMENEMIQHYNNTKSCGDIQYIMGGSKDYWIHSELYNKWANLYNYLNCDEVLKK